MPKYEEIADHAAASGADEAEREKYRPTQRSRDGHTLSDLTPEKIDELERQMRHLVCDECGLLVFVGEDTDPPPCCGEMRRRVPALIRAARELPEIRAEVARLKEVMQAVSNSAMPWVYFEREGVRGTGGPQEWNNRMSGTSCCAAAGRRPARSSTLHS